MNDRELLELAAKASGYEFDLSMLGDGPALALDGMRILGLRLACGAIWNPLEDDGDRYRLARDLRMCIDFNTGHVIVERDLFEIETRFEPGNKESEALAVVTAAAEIGKAKP